MAESREDRIRQRAYEIWEIEGFPPGRETEHWFRAEAEIAALEDTVFPNVDDPAAHSAPDPDDTDDAPVLGEEMADEAAADRVGLAEEPTPFTPESRPSAPKRDDPPVPGAGPGEARPAGGASQPSPAPTTSAPDPGSRSARPDLDPGKDKPAEKGPRRSRNRR